MHSRWLCFHVDEIFQLKLQEHIKCIVNKLISLVHPLFQTSGTFNDFSFLIDDLKASGYQGYPAMEIDRLFFTRFSENIHVPKKEFFQKINESFYDRLQKLFSFFRRSRIWIAYDTGGGYFMDIVGNRYLSQIKQILGNVFAAPLGDISF